MQNVRLAFLSASTSRSDRVCDVSVDSPVVRVDGNSLQYTDTASVRVEQACLVSVDEYVMLTCVEGDWQDSPRVCVLTVQPASVVRSIGERATDLKASSSIDGNSFPRRSARRRIPSHALWLKKYRGSTRGVSSSTSDKEHTLPSLWDGTSVSVHSDILCVQHPPGDAIPAFNQRPDEGTKVPSLS
jgi:hypothetical protein